MPTQAKSVWDDNIQVEEAKTAKNIPTRTGGALWRPCLIGLSLGILITGVVLTAIVVMFIQDSQKTTSTTTTSSTSSTSTSSTSTTTTTTTSTSTTTTTTTTTTTRTTSTTSTSSTSTTSRTTTTTTTSTTSTTSSPLPAQCFSYATNADSTRNFAYTATIGCDSGLFGGGTWVRFVSPAGTVIPSSAQSTYACGTHATGWYNGPYPSSPGTTTAGTVCYHWSGNTCYWSSAISITHCSTFYVFLLVDPPACSLRYCTA